MTSNMAFGGVLSLTPISQACQWKIDITMAASGRSGRLAHHRRTCISQQHSRLIVYNPPSKQAWLLRVVGEGLWPSKRSNVTAMHHCHNKGVFEGHRPSHPWTKAYPLAQGIIPYQSNMSAWNSRMVGEGLWPSKCSNVLAMHHCHNKGAF
jgi:hypothetical protein